MTTQTKVEAKANPKYKKKMLAPGHRACAGCGELMAAKRVAETLGPNTILANGTGCLEVTTSPYPMSSWGMPWIHSLFENPAAVASGILASLKQKKLDKKIKVVAQAGDGGTFDIGFGIISGMWERRENILFVCYDNEAYANTGMQASGATPWASSTTTTPSGTGNTIDAIGSHQNKKDMIAIAVAHGLKYVAQTTVGYNYDIEAKVKKAVAAEGPAYLQILSPCIPGWKVDPSEAPKLGRLASQTGLYPQLEYVNGKLESKTKITKKVKVEEYLKPQGRFAHLFKTDQGKEQIKYIQSLADENIKRYELMS